MVNIDKLVNVPLEPRTICGTYHRNHVTGADDYYAARGYCAVMKTAATCLVANFELEHTDGHWSYCFRGPLGIGWPTPRFRFGDEFKLAVPGEQTVLQTVVSILEYFQSIEL